MKILRSVCLILGVVALIFVIYQTMVLIAAISAAIYQPNLGKDPVDLLLNSWKLLLLFSGSLLLIRVGKDDEIERIKKEAVLESIRQDKRMQF